MYYLPVANQGWINCVQWPQGCGSLMWQGSDPTYCTSLGSRWPSVLRSFSQSLLRVYQMAKEVLSPEWAIQLTQHSPQTQMSTFYTFHSTKENLQLWYTRRKVYHCISTLKVPFTRDILQIRPDQDQELISFTTELSKPWANDAQSVASTRDIS